MEDLKTTILQLEAKLQRKDDELQARTQSFQEALAREQERSADRENKETARRNELNAKVLALTEERAQMKSQLANLQEIEEEAARREQELKIARRELVEFRVKSQDERKSLEEQLAEKRRAQERHRQEVSDLRCHISVLEHRLQHSQSKVATQDAHTDSLSKAQEEIRLLKEEKGNIERTLKTETARFAKDRKALEERAEQALNELRDLKSGPSRVELCAKYESQLDELRWITLDALQLVHRPGGPTPPTDASDPVALRAYVDSVAAHTRAHSFRLASNRGTSFAARRQAASPPQSPTHHQQAQQQQHQQQPPPSPSMPELESLAVSEDDIAVGLIAEAADLLVSLRQTLNLIPEEKQVALLRRFNDTVHAHAGETVSPGRGFGVTSGLPSVRDEPAALVNHIALLTHERDTLKSQLQIATEDLEATRQQLAAKQAGASNNTSKSNLNSPPRDSTTPQKKEDPPKSKDESSSPQATRPPPAAATADKPSPSSRRQAPSTNPPPLLSARRGNVGGGARA